MGVQLLYASVESPEVNKRFADLEKEPLLILSDPHRVAAKAYGVIRSAEPSQIDSMATRWTFYIDAKGRLAFIGLLVDLSTSPWALKTGSSPI